MVNIFLGGYRDHFPCTLFFWLLPQPLDTPLYKSGQSIKSALNKAASIATSVMSSLKAGAADEVEVKFGLDLSVESGVIISTVGGKVNFEVTLKWTGKGAE